MIIVDTDILIDELRGDKRATKFLSNYENEIFITYLTKMEILIGARNKKEMKIIDKALDYLILKIDDKILEESIRLLKEYSLKSNIGIIDSINAATAIVNELDFYTMNYKHYRGIKGLKIYKPY